MNYSKKYIDLWDNYYGHYTPLYCEAHRLFFVKNKAGDYIALTKSLFDYASEIVNTDLAFVMGQAKIIPASGNDKKWKWLENVLHENDWENMKYQVTVQGHVLGDTAVKIGRDEEKKMRIAPVDFTQKIDYVKANGKIVEWIYKWTDRLNSPAGEDTENTVDYEEHYSADRTQIYKTVGSKRELVADAPNNTGFLWFQHVPHVPSMKYGGVLGESEVESFQDNVDTINSLFSTIERIGWIYGNPKFLITGALQGQLNIDDNAWFIQDPTAKIALLEYKGDVIPSLRETAKDLREHLRERYFELVLSDLSNISGEALKTRFEKFKKKIGSYRERYFSFWTRVFQIMIKTEFGEKTELDFRIDAPEVVPENLTTSIETYIKLVESGILSRQSLSQKYGFDYDEEQKLIKEENATMGAAGDNSGKDLEALAGK